MPGGLEGLLVYQKAVAAEDAVSAILSRTPFRQHVELREQLDEASARVPNHISEGYGQKTDRHFAHFVFLARGEAQEMQGHLRSAYVRRCISEDELHDLQARYEEVAKMLSGLARHLRREDRKFRA